MIAVAALALGPPEGPWSAFHREREQFLPFGLDFEIQQ